MTHPAPEVLHAWLDGEPLSIEATAHVETCVDCRQVASGVRELNQAFQAWADDAAPSPADGFADRIVDIAMGPARVSSTRALHVRPRFRWIWGAAPIAFAAAASILFSIGLGGPSGGSTAQTVSTKPGSHVPHGTYVISVDPGAEHGTYSVLEVPGTHEGTTTSVVWIEDEPYQDSNAVE